ncbi:alpha/beta fold hydrolase [Mycolicibacterium baixiangningiae]|uniref:alpha/beta fold hydrolase n=1 Tax=Mycolicibacterium baixiangningiae TaxID=2761578 RepID=UPI001E451B56|nr:hypothetical protein [Mycolicibacterium baixiangningiae]
MEPPGTDARRAIAQHVTLLIVWGPHDGYMPEQSVRAYDRDLPDAALHLLGGGHRLPEIHLDEGCRSSTTSWTGCTPRTSAQSCRSPR